MLHKNINACYKKPLRGKNLLYNLQGQFSGFHSFIFNLNSSRLLLFRVVWHNFSNFRSSTMFTVASYLNFKGFDAWDVLARRFLDSKAKIKNQNISGTIETWENNSCQNAVFFHIISILYLTLDNWQYFWRL